MWVVFRTNAVEGVYSGANTWVAVDAPSTNPHYPDGYAPLEAVAIDYSASVAPYKWQGTYTEGSGTPILNPYGPDEAHYESIRDLKTPEKYAVYYNGSASPPRIYIQVSATQWERFDKDTSAPGDWSTSERFVASFLKNKQETYDGRVALNPDTDFDGVTNMAEVACGTNARNNDTDGDGIRDGVEIGLTSPGAGTLASAFVGDADAIAFIGGAPVRNSMKVALRKGDPAFLLEYLRTHKPDPELADLVEEASRRMRRDLKPR